MNRDTKVYYHLIEVAFYLFEAWKAQVSLAFSA